MVVFGLVPTFLGGPIFAAAMLLLGVAGYREYTHLTKRALRVSRLRGALSGMYVVGALAVSALLGLDGAAITAIVAVAVSLPLVAQLGAVNEPSGMATWSSLSSGSLYLGIPVFTAISLRSLPGGEIAMWLTNLENSLALAWPARPLGLAWILTVVLAIWIGDSAAYLGGRAFGRRRMAPELSPNKTWEGAAIGFGGSTLTSIATFTVVGLGPWWVGALVGAALGFAGQLGDLCESFLKRQAGAKDSGNLLPGHGGILDRIDALFFALPLAYFLALVYESSGLR